MKITAERLREILSYNPITGVFLWRERHISTKSDTMFNTRYAGRQAGYVDDQGYVRIQIKQGSHKAHRLAWLYMTGVWPTEEIDHIDRDRANNSFSNLRPATSHQNALNRSRRRDNTTGAKGVHVLRKKTKTLFRARITVRGDRVLLGDFATLEEAAHAYRSASKKMHGPFSSVADVEETIKEWGIISA